MGIRDLPPPPSSPPPLPPLEAMLAGVLLGPRWPVRVPPACSTALRSTLFRRRVHTTTRACASNSLLDELLSEIELTRIARPVPASAPAAGIAPAHVPGHVPPTQQPTRRSSKASRLFKHHIGADKLDYELVSTPTLDYLPHTPHTAVGRISAPNWIKLGQPEPKHGIHGRSAYLKLFGNDPTLVQADETYRSTFAQRVAEYRAQLTQ